VDAALERRVRRFRIAFAVVVAWPLIARIALAVLGEYQLGWWDAAALAFVAGLLSAGVQHPSGIVPLVVVIYLCIDGVTALVDEDIQDWWAIIVWGEALAIVALLMPIRSVLRSMRGGWDLDRGETGADAHDRRSSARRTERALRRTAED
jgi:hypothetical protein